MRTRLAVLLVFVGLAGVLVVPPTARGEEGTQDDGATSSDWTFSLAPYAFFTSMRGSIGVAGVSQNVSLNFWDIVGKTDNVFALQLHGEAWYRRRWGVLLDGTWQYLKASGDTSRSGRFGSSKVSVVTKSNVGYVEVGPLVHWMDGTFGSGEGTWGLDLILATRITIMGVSSDVTVQGPEGGSVSTSASSVPAWADAIAGPRMRFSFGPEERLEASLRFDAGVGGGSYSWNAVGMLGYDFDMFGVPSTAILGFRGFRQFYEKSDESFTWDITQFGPVLGLNMNF